VGRCKNNVTTIVILYRKFDVKNIHLGAHACMYVKLHMYNFCNVQYLC
jgi:hypothetical protein